MVLFGALTFGLNAEPGQEAAEIVKPKKAPSKIAQFLAFENRKKLLQSLMCSGGELTGKFLGAAIQSRCSWGQLNGLYGKILFGATVPDIAKAFARLGYDFLDEGALSNVVVSGQQNPGLAEKIACHALTNIVQTAVGFTGFEGDSTGKTISGSFGPKKKSEDGTTESAGGFCEDQFGNFAVGVALRIIDNGQYKDYLSQDSVAMPAFDAAESLLKHVDVDDVSFLNSSRYYKHTDDHNYYGNSEGIKGQNKLISKFMSKSISGVLAKVLSRRWAKYFAESGKTEKYNRFVKSLISAVLSSPAACLTNQVNPTK